MKKVIFVDDDSSLISGLKRMMRPLRNEWDMYFVLSGQEALDLLETDAFDVIVSDMRMPGINGAELLIKVREKYPYMVRIILSGYSDQDLLLKAVRPAHQFLTKPCDAETLKSTVQRASRIQNMLAGAELKQVVARVDSLPSLPKLYNEIMTKLQQEDISLKEIAEIIHKDVGMTSQILKLVNSSFFGFFKSISNPVQAAALLGLDTIKTLVLSIEIFSTLRCDQDIDFSFEDLWNHSMLTAACAKTIAKLITDDKTFIDDAFMAGFLHDIGILILASKMPHKYIEVLNKVRNEKKNIWEVEQEVLGTSHAEIGAYLLGLWGFAENIIEAIICHHNVEIFGDEPKSLILVLHLANSFAHQLEPGLKELAVTRLDQEYLKKINLSEQAKVWFAECKKVYEAGVL